MTIQHTTCGQIGAIKLIFPDDTRREITVGMLRDDPAGAAETLRRYVAAVAAVGIERAVDAVVNAVDDENERFPPNKAICPEWVESIVDAEVKGVHDACLEQSEMNEK